VQNPKNQNPTAGIVTTTERLLVCDKVSQYLLGEVKTVSKHNVSESMHKVYAYGFDKLGFKLPRQPLQIDGHIIVEFIAFEDTSQPIDAGIGAIIPQGIFEDIRYDNAQHRIIREDEIWVRRELLAAKELQAVNLVQSGRWLAVLVDRVVDEISTQSCNDTDVCKRLLNRYAVQRTPTKDRSPLTHKRSEFEEYIKTYGVSRTMFRLDDSNDSDAVVLSTAGEEIVGMEFDRNCFFLPFHTDKHTARGAEALAATIVRAVESYRSKEILSLPSWLDDFVFEGENKDRARVESLEADLLLASRDFEKWSRFKGVLVSSGEILRGIVADILEQFFGLRVDRTDVCREDGRILDADGEVLAVLETKGVSGGIKRAHVNSLDTNRERSNLDASIPGLLIVNNAMNLRGLEERKATTVHPEILNHAAKLNIAVLRSVDLLVLMRHMEGIENRGERFLEMLRSSKGQFAPS